MATPGEPASAWLLAGLLGLIACGGGSPRESVKPLMEADVAPASDAIFNAVVFVNGRMETAPATDAQWRVVGNHARALGDAGRTLAAGPPGADNTVWLAQAAALSTSAREALQAAEARDVNALLAAGSRIYDTCTACHARYIIEQ